MLYLANSVEATTISVGATEIWGRKEYGSSHINGIFPSFGGRTFIKIKIKMVKFGALAKNLMITIACCEVEI